MTPTLDGCSRLLQLVVTKNGACLITTTLRVRKIQGDGPWSGRQLTSHRLGDSESAFNLSVVRVVSLPVIQPTSPARAGLCVCHGRAPGRRRDRATANQGQAPAAAPGLRLGLVGGRPWKAATRPPSHTPASESRHTGIRVRRRRPGEAAAGAAPLAAGSRTHAGVPGARAALRVEKQGGEGLFLSRPSLALLIPLSLSWEPFSYRFF